VNLEDVSRLRADFRVPEQFSSRLRPQQTVRLTSDAFPGKTFPAKVTAVDSAVDVSGRSLLVRAELVDESRRLKPGMFVRVSLVLETRANAIVVPEEALVTAQGRTMVFKVVEGKAVASPVQTGLRTMLDGKPVVEVVKGLAVGETVVTVGQIKIRGNNVPVRIAGSERPASGAPPAKPDGMPKADAPAPAKSAPPTDSSKKGA
jgi:membrane fusion protein (multidrug efflux system)